MTDRELLEEIKRAYGYGNKLDVNTYPHWLISRVQELEKLCEQLIGEEWMNDEGLYESEMMKLDRQNKRYREVIEKAMDELNHGCKYHAHYVLEQTLEGEE